MATILHPSIARSSWRCITTSTNRKSIATISYELTHFDSATDSLASLRNNKPWIRQSENNGNTHATTTAATDTTPSFGRTPHHDSMRRNFSSSSSSIETRKDALTSSDGVVGLPIDFDIASSVEGKESQIVTIRLEPDQVLRAESGAMMYMTDGISMNTTTGGGLSAGFKRMLTGQNVFISDYTYDGSSGPYGYVALGTDFPSKIVRLSLEEYGGKIVCQKGALLCASHTVNINVEFTKSFGGGFFGGEGFVLQGLTGTGDVMVKAGGTLIRKDLREGEVLRVSSGCLVGFQEGVEFDVQMVPGFKNVLFGGEGLFLTTLTGPGTVWLQGQPPQRMISEIA
eukprot:CAMPEP_0196131210 /NCGR_PEP_ID=MMETSP0910-20130528/1314_1 /TAXON_ID=49265 /ORGANISM="Thalassiosira rotula, Strain GSO102" /LENGTH=340 /DNA_ID=CAMNT_0041390657 /DNA_START=17 /DNA_END=1036 /DNA_ORIENTATION=-